MAPLRGLHSASRCAGHRGTPTGPTRTKTRRPPTWRRILTSSQTSGPPVSVWAAGLRQPGLPQAGSGPAGSLPGGRAGASISLLLPEMKMYSLAVTPNGHPEGRGSLPPPLIMRTAATPMPTPKSSPYLDPAPGLLDSRRGSGSSVDPQLGDQKSLVGTLPCPGLRAPPSPGSLWPLPRMCGPPHTPQSHCTNLCPQAETTALSLCKRSRGTTALTEGACVERTRERVAPSCPAERQVGSLSPDRSEG